MSKPEPGAEYTPDVEPEPVRLEYRDPGRKRYLPTRPSQKPETP